MVQKEPTIVDYQKYKVIYLHDFSKQGIEKVVQLKKQQNRKTIIRLSKDSKEQAYNVLRKANEDLKKQLRIAEKWDDSSFHYSRYIIVLNLIFKIEMGQSLGDCYLIVDQFKHKNGYPFLYKAKREAKRRHYMGFIDDILNYYSMGERIEF